MTTDRKAIAAAFRAAKPLLWDGASNGGERFICHAINESNHSARFAAMRVIQERLNCAQRGCYSLCRWLEFQGIAWRHLTPKRLQAHRHAWLDMLIAEFEGEEK
jgi:hypothetical protein